MTAPSSEPPKAFVSHNHADKPLAEQLARALRNEGVDAWFDSWEIQPGDSLIQKIFTEGLGKCSVFLVLLSPESVESKWVREELDVALIQRIEGTTRVVPVVVRPCVVPVALRALRWLDLASSDPGSIARQVADIAHGRSDKPPVRSVAAPRPVPGLTAHAASIALLFVPIVEKGDRGGYNGAGLAETLKLDAEQVNDAIDELKSLGALKTHDSLGTRPFNFGVAYPTYVLPLLLRDSGALSYDPQNDIVEVAAAIAALKHVRGAALAGRLEVSPGRINNAVNYLGDHGHAHVLHALGTKPYDFMQVEATAATRRFVQEHAK